MIKIGGHTLQLVWEDIEDMGVYIREENLIKIKRGMTPDQDNASLVHEVLHHIWAEAGLRGVLGQELEERIVVAFEGGILSFIKDNPEVMEAIMAKKKKVKKTKPRKVKGY